MEESFLFREKSPEEVASILLATSCNEDTAKIARDMMHAYHNNISAHTYWCEVVYFIENKNKRFYTLET